jgi:hypothetical protein
MCSSLIPVYDIGMLKPANSAIFAPNAICLLVNGVGFILKYLFANVTQKKHSQNW